MDNLWTAPACSYVSRYFCFWRQHSHREFSVYCSADVWPVSGGELYGEFYFLGISGVYCHGGSVIRLRLQPVYGYAEPEWVIDLFLTVVWVVYLTTFLGTILRRKEPHIYVANWFLLAVIVVVAMLHISNGMAIPVSLLGMKSYSLYSGVQSAMIQWWYGHNAVGFFKTAGFLGMMYYYVPKEGAAPCVLVPFVYCSLLGFVVSLYMGGAPPSPLHVSAGLDADPGDDHVSHFMDAFVGGMINGLMTLSGAWDKLRTDPVMRFLVTSVAFYGMSTFEGPMMAIKAVNSLSHYTDWTIGHVHSGALGWVAFISFGAMYYLVPVLWKRQSLYSMRLVSYHFWIATIGIVLYISAMWVSGIMQGLM